VTPPTTLPRWFRFVGLLSLVAVVAASIYFAYAFAGPYRAIAELQMRLSDSYHPQLTFVFTLLALLLPAVAVLKFAQGAGWLPRPGDPVADAANGAVVQARVTAIKNWALMAAIGAVGVFVGIRQQHEARAGTELTRVRCEQLEAGQVPDASWLEIEGNPVWDAALEASHDYGQFTYVPLISAGWSRAQPVGAMLRIDRNERHPADGPSFRGARIPDGLPGFVRTQYEEAGLDVARAVVLEHGMDPAARTTQARFFVIAGAVLLAIGTVATVLRWRRTGAAG
jgi:hypothetical protein